MSLIQVGSPVKIERSGIRKPADCRFCSMAAKGVGFCADEFNPGAKIAVLLETPAKDEILDGRPMAGKVGKFWERVFIKDLGLTREDFVICNLLRCYPGTNPKTKKLDYPTGERRKEAEKACRQYDAAIKRFDPTVFVVTFHPAAALQVPAMIRLIQADIQKAIHLSRSERPLLLMGDRAKAMVLPDLAGPIKDWRGHFVRGGWTL